MNIPQAALRCAGRGAQAALVDPIAGGEPGYDLTYVHAARQFLTGVEGLLNVKEPRDFRLNWDAAIRSSNVTLGCNSN